MWCTPILRSVGVLKEPCFTKSALKWRPIVCQCTSFRMNISSCWVQDEGLFSLVDLCLHGNANKHGLGKTCHEVQTINQLHALPVSDSRWHSIQSSATTDKEEGATASWGKYKQRWFQNIIIKKRKTFTNLKNTDIFSLWERNTECNHQRMFPLKKKSRFKSE